MFNYLSYTTFADIFYDKNKHNKQIINETYSKNLSKTYSLGISLSKKKLGTIASIYGTQKLFLTIIELIKKHNLTNDKNAMNLLYGHIIHYFYDININPYVTYLSYNLKKTSFLMPNEIIKDYLTNYLIEKTYNKNILEIKENCFNMKIEDTTKFIINKTYKKIYNKENIYKSYQSIINSLNLLENNKNSFIVKETLKLLINFKTFINENNLTSQEILNTNNTPWQNPVTGEINNTNYSEQIKKALKDAKSAIEGVNEVLYNKKQINLEDIFKNLSYDTGENLKLTEKKYYRKRDLK